MPSRTAQAYWRCAKLQGREFVLELCHLPFRCVHRIRVRNREGVATPSKSEADLSWRLPWTPNVSGLAFAAELEDCIAYIGLHVAEQPFDGGKIAVRRAEREGRQDDNYQIATAADSTCSIAG